LRLQRVRGDARCMKATARQAKLAREPRRPGDPAAVVGVVLAAVVAMAVATGPFDWWATMVGLTLLAVLWGYAHEPASRAESVGLAAAIALAVIYTIGAPIERLFDTRISGENESGDVVLGIWAVGTVVAFGWLELRRTGSRLPFDDDSRDRVAIAEARTDQPRERNVVAAEPRHPAASVASDDAPHPTSSSLPTKRSTR
jgi:hypothetical protein